MRIATLLLLVPIVLGLQIHITPVVGQEANPTEAETQPADEAEAENKPEGFAAPEGLTPIHPASRAWIDIKRRLVVVDGFVAVTRGQLEMFACPKGTKEHESIVAIDGKAWHVHAGLLAVGAVAGHPVRFDPKYEPAAGTPIDIWVLFKDEKGKRQRVRAQSWVRNVKTKKEMKHDWVFGGSNFWRDPTTDIDYYQGDGGDFICVSNFTTATLDLPIESTQGNEGLLFEAFSERIPKEGTPIRLVLVPRIKKERSETAADPDAASKDGSGDASAPEEKGADENQNETEEEGSEEEQPSEGEDPEDQPNEVN